MAISIFQAFRSTVTPFTERLMRSTDRWLADPVTGAIIGVESPTANGAHGRFTPVDITAAQLAAPTALMVADLDATFRLNVAPYPRYMSNGVTLVPIGASETETVIPAGQTPFYASPLTVATPQVLIVEGGIRVISLP